MRDNALWLALSVLAVGALGYYLTKDKMVKSESPNEKLVLEQLPASEKKKFSPALLREYDLVVPPFMARKSAQIKADEITAKRFTIDPLKVKNPLYL